MWEAARMSRTRARSPEAPGPQINSWQWRRRIAAFMRWCRFESCRPAIGRWPLPRRRSERIPPTRFRYPATPSVILPIPLTIRSFRPLARERELHTTHSSRHRQVLARLFLDKVSRVFFVARFVIFPIELYNQPCPLAYREYPLYTVPLRLKTDAIPSTPLPPTGPAR